MNEPIAKAVQFESRKIYQSHQHPGYTAWVSFFRGERGQWYLTCEEVTRPNVPLPQCAPEQWFSMNLPAGGYDKSQYLMEIVILESTDDMKTWKVISREPCRFHHSAGSYSNQARTRDGRFLRFVWPSYSLDPATRREDIYYESSDDGKTWRKMPSFVDPHFETFPNRLRILRDGTIVLCVPHAPVVKLGTERPMRGMSRLDVMNEWQMTVFFSHDQGRSWNGPMPIFGAQNVSEVDFAELPDGNLLFINSSIHANPGRQFVYRNGNRFTPGPLEKVKHIGHDAYVPETVCLTENGILIGCIRCSEYVWSDDLGQSWWRIQGIPVLEGGMKNPQRREGYQPSIEYLGNGLVACAGHFGGDDPLGLRDQYIHIHFFTLEVLSKRIGDTQIRVNRDFDSVTNHFRNTYTISLSCDGVPLPDKELEFWYVERNKPGYDDQGKFPLEERMKIGGTLIRLRTDKDGNASVSLPEMDKVTDIHFCYQFIVRFNADRSDPNYRPTQTLQFSFYALWRRDPPLERLA